MKKLFAALTLLVSAVAFGQTVPLFTYGQVLTSAALNQAFAATVGKNNAVFTGTTTIPNAIIGSGTVTGVTGVTANRLDNTASLATNQFVNQQGSAATATVPFTGVTGGVWNQASLGTGGLVVVFVTSSPGPVSSILSVVTGGTGYAVGDLLVINSGNTDAVLRVTSVGAGGALQTGGLAVAYGGTGYMTGAQATTIPVPPGRRTVNFTGTLTSNLTFIIQSGSFLTASRQVQFINNTTGPFTITVKVSNGAGGSTGNGVVLPQGVNNSTAMLVYTNGVTDVWPAVVPLSTPRILGQSAVQASVTGTTTETVLATIPIPANAVGLNGSLRITAVWRAGANNANVKSVIYRYGGTVITSTGVTSTLTYQDQRVMYNRGVSNSQVTYVGAAAYGAGSTVGLTTTTVDSTQAQNLTLSAALANTSDTVFLEAYTVEVLNP